MLTLKTFLNSMTAFQNTAIAQTNEEHYNLLIDLLRLNEPTYLINAYSMRTPRATPNFLDKRGTDTSCAKATSRRHQYQMNAIIKNGKKNDFPYFSIH